MYFFVSSVDDMDRSSGNRTENVLTVLSLKIENVLGRLKSLKYGGLDRSVRWAFWSKSGA